MRCLNAPYCEHRAECNPEACDSFVPVEGSELEGAGGCTMSRSQRHLANGATLLRSIIKLLAEAPATTGEVAMTQHIGNDTAQRLMRVLYSARIVEHPTRAKAARGLTPPSSPQLKWRLSNAYMRGDVPFVPEDIARIVIDPAMSRRQYRCRRYGMHFSLFKPQKIAAKGGVV